MTHATTEPLTSGDAEFAIGGRSLESHLREGGAWSLLGKVVGGLLIFAMNLLLVRLLPASGVGAYYLVFSLAAAAAMLGQFGIGQATIRKMGELLAQGDTAGAHRIARHAILIVSPVAAAMFVILVALPLDRVVARLFPATPIGHLIPLAAAWAGLMLIQSIVAEVFRGLAEIRRAVITFDVAPNLLITAALLALVLFAPDVGLRGVLWICVTAVTVNTAVALFELNRRLEARRWEWERGELLQLVRLGLPVWLATIAFAVMANAPLWIIGAFRSGEEVALFGVATKLSNLVGLPLLVVNGVLSPLIPQMYARGRRESLQAVLQGSAALAAIPAVGCLLLLLLFREQGLAWIFGPFYANALAIALALMIGQTINVLAGPCGLVLIMTGHQRAASVILVTFTTLGVSVAAALAPLYGSLAVAVVVGITIAMQNVFTSAYARRVIGLKTYAALSSRILANFNWRNGSAGRV